MAAVLQSNTVRAGLVYQAVGLGVHLKQALAEAGVQVVLEVQAHELDGEKLKAAGLDVFVVNLDPELEDHLDEIADMLDGFDCPVIYNDGATSSGLAGWDQARWARHLASKIKGEIDAHPPRPMNAQSIPTPVKPKAPVVVAPVAKPSVSAPVPVAAPPVAVAKPVVVPAPVPTPVAAKPAPPVPAPPPKRELPPTLEFERIELPSATEFPELALDLDSELDTPFTERALDAGSGSSEFDEGGFGDFDPSAFDLADEISNFRPRETNELTDLDALLQQAAPRPEEAQPAPKAAGKSVETPSKRTEPVRGAPPAETPAAKPGATRAAAELKAPPMSWSLEPLENEPLPAPADAIFGRAKYDAKELVKPSLPPAKPAAAPPPPVVAPKAEGLGDTDLAGFDFFLEPEDLAPKSQSKAPPPQVPAIAPVASKAPAQVQPTAPASNDHGGLSDLDALFADLDSVGAEPADSRPANDFGGGDFDFDLDVDFEGSDSEPASGKPASPHESSFADLDSLFAEDELAPPPQAQAVKAKAAVPVAAAASQAPRHVFVLGASIGGPEAVRSFLSKLKPSVPAAFVLAQHMGAEFLDLMANQLAKASVLPVKLAQDGELLREGVVVVVPVNRRFEVDASGHVRFADLASESPYSPSIDQVLSDMADRFGTRCTAIIFSGMASDAVEGSKYLASRGAKVWVQDPATCVISSMIDGAQAAGIVSFVGAPEQLAEHVLDELGVL